MIVVLWVRLCGKDCLFGLNGSNIILNSDFRKVGFWVSVIVII